MGKGRKRRLEGEEERTIIITFRKALKLKREDRRSTARKSYLEEI